MKLHNALYRLSGLTTRSLVRAVPRSMASGFADDFGNDSVEPLRWERGPIEMTVIDCGRTLAVNEVRDAGIATFLYRGSGDK